MHKESPIPNEVVIKPAGNIKAQNADDLRAALLSIVKKYRKSIVIDMTDIQSVDSIGIGLLISTHNSVQQYGGYLKLANLENHLYKLFTNMRLDKYFILEEKTS